MRLLPILVSTLLLIRPAAADDSSTDGTQYGFGVSLTDSTPFDQLLSDPAALLDQTVRVEGTIKEVCPYQGCWLDLEDPNGAVVRVKVTDGEIVFPVEATGKRAVAEGTWSLTKLTHEQAIRYVRHLAEEKGELESFDPATVTGPLDIYRITGSGAVIH